MVCTFLGINVHYVESRSVKNFTSTSRAAVVLPNRTIPRFTLEPLNHQAAIQIVQRESRSFVSFTLLLVPLHQMLHLVSLLVRGLGGWNHL